MEFNFPICKYPGVGGAEYVPVVRWFRENEKNKGAGFKIKPESLTCLKDRVKKEIAFLGTRYYLTIQMQSTRSLFIPSP